MRRHLAPHPDSGPVIAARATLYGDERWVLYSTAAATRRALPTRRWSLSRASRRRLRHGFAAWSRDSSLSAMREYAALSRRAALAALSAALAALHALSAALHALAAALAALAAALSAALLVALSAALSAALHALHAALSAALAALHAAGSPSVRGTSRSAHRLTASRTSG